MVMPVMNIRKVPVAVGERGMGVIMVVWLLLIPRVGMGVLMVRIMGVPVSVLNVPVPVRVLMPLRQVQPDTQGH
jgi:hypothetical protein